MPKLYFRYGTMNSSKTANLLMVAHNYTIQNKRVLLLKPAVDTRPTDSRTIESRVGIVKKVDLLVTPTTNILDELRVLASLVPVICYGLRTDYRMRFFPGSRRLMEVADTVEEIKTTCSYCNRKAIVNAKFFINTEGQRVIVRNGTDVVELGAEDKYMPMCFNCWKV